MVSGERDILYEKMIVAQYEYFKYMEPILIKEFEEKIKDKVSNPYHWKNRVIPNIESDKEPNKEPNTEPNKKSNKEPDKESFRKLLYMFHPDKNIENKELAHSYFVLIQELIEKKSYRVLREI